MKKKKTTQTKQTKRFTKKEKTLGKVCMIVGIIFLVIGIISFMVGGFILAIGGGFLMFYGWALNTKAKEDIQLTEKEEQKKLEEEERKREKEEERRKQEEFHKMMEEEMRRQKEADAKRRMESREEIKNDPKRMKEEHDICVKLHNEYDELMKEYKKMKFEDDWDVMPEVLGECYEKLNEIRFERDYYDCYSIAELDVDTEIEKLEKKAKQFINKYIKTEKEVGNNYPDLSRFEDDLSFISVYLSDMEDKILGL